MTAKKKVTSGVWQKVISRINLNTIILAIVGSYFTYKNTTMDTKQNTIILNQDTVKSKQVTVNTIDSSFRKKSEDRWRKVDSNFATQNHKLDSLILLTSKK